MKAKPTKPETLDDYIAGFPSDIQKLLRKVRATVRKAAPGAEEEISSGYKSAKGSVQFPLDRPIPYGLIGRIVKFRVRENLQRAKLK